MLAQFQKELDTLEEQLKRKKFQSSHLVAEKICKLFYKYFKQNEFNDPGKLLMEIKMFGDQIIKADKLNFVVPNTIKRIIHVFREACHQCKLDKELEKNTKILGIGGMADFG